MGYLQQFTFLKYFSIEFWVQVDQESCTILKVTRYITSKVFFSIQIRLSCMIFPATKSIKLEKQIKVHKVMYWPPMPSTK